MRGNWSPSVESHARALPTLLNCCACANSSENGRQASEGRDISGGYPPGLAQAAASIGSLGTRAFGLAPLRGAPSYGLRGGCGCFVADFACSRTFLFR